MSSKGLAIDRQGFEETRKCIDISFHHISLSVQIEDKQASSFCAKKYKDKILLNDVSGLFKAGELSVIFGSSGAGKTTLLNILACRTSRKNFQGKVCANGVQYSFQDFGSYANYVTQKDVLIQTLTVKETLRFAADLKLVLSEQQKNDRVIALCRMLKLQKCLDTMVGGAIVKGISGGEKKRTSIAFELISDPSVLILDQPTSGLDSLTSFIIIKYLKKLATSNKKTIVLTIHQPSPQIYDLFDKLLFLVQGQLIYQGPREQVIQYFSYNFGLVCPQFSNPAEYFMSIMHQQSVFNRLKYLQFFKCYRERIGPEIEKQILSAKTDNQLQKRAVDVSFFTCFTTLLYRDYIHFVKNPMLIKVRLLQTIILSIYVGGLYCQFSGEYMDVINWHALYGFCYFLSFHLMMMAINPVQLIFPSEKEVFMKEEGSKLYGVGAYFLSRNIVEIPYSLIFSIFQSVIMYWFVGLSSTPEQFFTFFLITFLIGFVGASIGLFIGSLAIDPRSAIVITPLALVPFYLFSGMFKNAGTYPAWIGWIQYISPIKYAFTAYLENEVKYASSSRISEMNFDVGLWGSIGILIALGVVFRLASLFFLWLFKAKYE